MTKSITLAIGLPALKQLAEPAAAIRQSRSWARYIGVIAAVSDVVVREVTREYGINPDFTTGPDEPTETLALLPQQFDTDRYILVGTATADRWLPEQSVWEYRPLKEAATSADWELTTSDQTTND